MGLSNGLELQILSDIRFRFCCSGRIPRPSLIQHSLYVGVVEKPTPPPLTGGQYGKMEPKYPEGGHYQSVLRPQGVFNVPPLFLVIQWRRQRHLTWLATHDYQILFCRYIY